MARKKKDSAQTEAPRPLGGAEDPRRYLLGLRTIALRRMVVAKSKHFSNRFELFKTLMDEANRILDAIDTGEAFDSLMPMLRLGVRIGRAGVKSGNAQKAWEQKSDKAKLRHLQYIETAQDIWKANPSLSDSACAKRTIKTISKLREQMGIHNESVLKQRSVENLIKAHRPTAQD